MRIVFCCTGNTCRSPMAEKILIDRLKKANITGVEVSSCGVMCGVGHAMSQHSMMTLQGMNITDYYHQSRPISSEIINSSDLIVCMTAGHKDAVVQRFGVAVEVVVPQDIDATLSDIIDPYGGSMPAYKACCQMIEGLVEAIMAKKINGM